MRSQTHQIDFDIFGGEKPLFDPDEERPEIGGRRPYGALRGLAVTGPHRVSELPEVPTFAEAGLPGVEVVLWFAATVPAGTPQPIAAKLRADLVQAVSDPEFKKALEARSLEVKTMTSEELGAFMERDDEKFRVLIQKLGLKVE